MSGHTPGPWSIQQSPQRHDGEFDFAVSAHGARILAECFGRAADKVGTILPANANARLIAASPELLEALKGLVQINEQHNEAVGKIIKKPLTWKDSYLDAARSAIAKAEGGAP